MISLPVKGHGTLAPQGARGAFPPLSPRLAVLVEPESKSLPFAAFSPPFLRTASLGIDPFQKSRDAFRREMDFRGDFFSIPRPAPSSARPAPPADSPIREPGFSQDVIYPLEITPRLF